MAIVVYPDLLLVSLSSLKTKNKWINNNKIKTKTKTKNEKKRDIYQTRHLPVMDHFIVQMCHVMGCQKVVLKLLQFVICKVM